MLNIQIFLLNIKIKINIFITITIEILINKIYLKDMILKLIIKI